MGDITYPIEKSVGKGAGSLRFYHDLDCPGSSYLILRQQVSWITIEKGEDFEGHETFTIYYDENKSTPRDGEVIPVIMPLNKSCPQKSIIIHQDGSSDCGCGSFGLDYSPVTWKVRDTDDKYRSYNDVTCIDPNDVIVTIKRGEDYFGVQNLPEEHKIKFWPKNTLPTETLYGSVEVRYKVNGEECTEYIKSISLSQDGTNCDCNSFGFDSSPITWQAGNTLEVKKSYADVTCISPNDVVVTIEQGSDYFGVQNLPGEHKIKFWPKQESSISQRTGKIKIKYSANGSECLNNIQTVRLIQEGNGCYCGLLSFMVDGVSVKASDEIVWDYNESGPGNSKTITYSIDNTKAGCIDGDITVKIINGNGFSYEEDAANHSITIWPTQDNPDEEPVTATLQYSYKLTDGTICDGYNDSLVLYQVENDYCQCDHLSVGCARKTFAFDARDKYGYSQSYILANGNTNGCGEFTEIKYDGGTSQPSWLTATTVNTSDTDRQIKVSLKYDPYQTESRSCDIKYVFKRKHGDVVLNSDCDYSFSITQTNDYIDCDRIDSAKALSATSELSYFRENKTIGRLGQTSFQANTYRILIENGIISSDSFTVPSSAASWINNFSTEFKYETINGEDVLTNVYVKADVSENNTGSDRNTTVKLRLNASKLKSIFGICNCSSLTKTFYVKQKKQSGGDTCDCKEDSTPSKYSVNSAAGLFERTVGLSYPISCFKTTGYKIILADENGNIIQDSDTAYKTIPNYTWLSGKVEPYGSSTNYHAKLYLNYELNDREDDRKAIFYIIYNLDNNSQEPCMRRFEFTQEGKVSDCSDLLDSIKEPAIARDYSGVSSTMVSYVSNLLVPDSKMSGVTKSSTANWVNSVFIKNDDKKSVYADLKDNIATSGDGYTNERETTIEVFFVDNEGNIISMGGDECRKTVTIKQKGYTGACPLPSTMTIENMIPNYDGYGDLMSDGTTHWTCEEVGLGELPAFHHVTPVISKNLFECELNGCTTEFDGKTVPCYTLSANSTDTGYIYSVGATQDSTDENKFIIKGIIGSNTTEKSVPVAITLTLMRYDYSDGGALKPTTITRTCHISVLPNGKDCQGQPITD